MSLWTDEDIRRRVSAVDAVEWMREAVLLNHSGELTALARLTAAFDDARLVVTAGRVSGRWYGYRSYDTLPVTAGRQVVVVHDDGTGDVLAVAVGNELGPRRTGALGAVAAQCFTLGPKQLDRAEFPPELLTDAAQLVTDSLAQLNAYDPPAIGAKRPELLITELGALAAGEVTAQRSGRRVYLSVGLAGTEVHLLGHLAETR